MMKPNLKYFNLFILIAVQNPCFAQYSTSGSYAVASGNTDVLDTYVSAVINGANSSPVLSKVISQAASIKALAEFAYAALYADYYRGSYDARDFAIYITRPVAAKFMKINPATQVRIFANVAGRQLLNDGILNGINSALFASEQVKAMERGVQNKAGVNDTVSQYQVLVDGLIGILRTNVHRTNARLMSIENILGQEIKHAVKKNRGVTY